jgi:amino acid permease
MATTNVRIRPLTIILVVVAVVLVAIGIVYLTKTAADLPSFFPGHTAHDTEHHTKHGLAAIGLAVVALIGAWLTTAPEKAA